TFVRTAGEHQREAALILEGITCAACVWLNERHVAQLPGVLDVQVNYATHRARVRWDDTRIKLSDILQAIHNIGYTAHPYDPQQQQQAFERERRNQLRRIGIAGVLGMQVMVLSIALYIGDWSGMEAGFRTFFRWIGLLLTTPVLLYSGAPFFRGAWRDLRNRSAGMDVPVALGILVAFGGSLHASWTGQGQVYYDSVVMFIFFLLTSRFFELMARKRGAEALEQLSQAMPAMATRITLTGNAEQQDVIPLTELQPGDTVLIKPGETVPADGTIITGESSVSEALLSGESTPISKEQGAHLIGGSINMESPLYLRVEQVGLDTILAEILRLLEQAQNEKPAITLLADRVASWFVGTVLVVAAAVGYYWWQQAPDSWLPVLVAVLVVTCPCALSLATPTAISAATGTMLGYGLLIIRNHSLETLANSSHVIFDKTGTLTFGTPVITRTQCLSHLDERTVLAIAAALEQQSEHPAGKAIVTAAASSKPVTASDYRNFPGAGISAQIDDRRWFIGNAKFIAAHTNADSECLPDDIGFGTQVVLADAHQLHARFLLQDTIRPEAPAVIKVLQDAGKQVLLMSGDNSAAAQQLASEAGIDEVRAGMTPVDKLQQVQALQQQGAVVVMVGDGINDAPVLAAADVSIVMRDAAHISQASADMVLLSNNLAALPRGILLARKTRGIIKQNLSWAVGYNLVALPAAALGFVAPWMAAIGMSSSSLLVVLNALRLTRSK
ncbi:MAG: cation-translocating P-type ATPase, partial [Gammaproteobacteria bacterium]|nr:cation-translocating P-type ATPase [Gammaproteobacteria bacterium]